MSVEFTRSWNDEEVGRFRESWVRFVETEMQPQDAEARKRVRVRRSRTLRLTDPNMGFE
jgi:acyl-CoA dehydrogenase